MTLQNRVVVVTGHCSGIGQAVCQRCLADGARVFGLSLPEHDLCQLEMIPEWIADIYAEAGKIDVLVNNAGINHIGNIEHTTLEEFDQLITVNLKAAFQTMKSVLPEMKQAGYGRIINIASDQAVSAKYYGAAYASSKAGLLQLSRSSAVDYAQYGITINCVCPGSTDTQMLYEAVDSLQDKYPAEFDDNYLQKSAQSLPIKRYAKPEEIANAIVFLASEQASYITGALIPVDGGGTAG